MNPKKVPGLDKATLRTIFEMKPRKFQREMNLMIENTNFMEIFPFYEKNSRLLYKPIFVAICRHFGWEEYEIAERIIDCYDLVDERDTKRIRGLFRASEHENKNHSPYSVTQKDFRGR